MYISSIELKNIRCFKDFKLSLKTESNVTFLTAILGDNAVGKSTLLKSIAMGLSDEASAAALMKEIKGEFLRKEELQGSIKIELSDNENIKYFVTTNISRRNLYSPERVKQIIEPKKDFSWEKVFICGYGVSRGGVYGEVYDKYETLEAVYSLFNPTSGLQNPETILNRQEFIIIKH